MKPLNARTQTVTFSKIKLLKSRTQCPFSCVNSLAIYINAFQLLTRQCFMNKEDAAQRESARNPYLLRAGILDNTDPCVNARNGEVRDDIFKERFH